VIETEMFMTQMKTTSFVFL